MVQSLFESIYTLNNRFENEHLTIHEIKNNLIDIVNSGRTTTKLRIITQFLCSLEVLARTCETQSEEKINQAIEVIIQGFTILKKMIEGTISNFDGAQELFELMFLIRNMLQHYEGALLLDERLLEQLFFDVSYDMEQIEDIIQQSKNNQGTKKDSEMLLYYLKRMQSSFEFIGLNSLEQICSMLIDLFSEYHQEEFCSICSQNTVKESLELVKKQLDFINTYKNNKAELQKHFIDDSSCVSTESSPHAQDFMDCISISSGVNLTPEEITALMGDTEGYTVVSFDDIDKSSIVSEASAPKEIDIVDESRAISEDQLIQLTTKLFFTQERLKDMIQDQNKSLVNNEIIELDLITKELKELLFNQYYITISDLMGKELRSYIFHESEHSGKKIRLGIRGEHNQVLARDKIFIKKLVLDLVKNSLHHSIESPIRRRALDKSETAWLLIEFEHAGDVFDIRIRDDGRGWDQYLEENQQLVRKIHDKGGSITVDSEETEYLKVHVSLPMRRLFIDSLVMRIGDVKVLIPVKNILEVVSTKALNDPNFLKKDGMIGQIGLAPLLDVGIAPTNMLVVCEFGEEKIVFGVEEVLYEIQAFIERMDTPLIACSNGVAILKDGSIGFLMDERQLYYQAKRLIVERKAARK